MDKNGSVNLHFAFLCFSLFNLHINLCLKFIVCRKSGGKVTQKSLIKNRRSTDILRQQNYAYAAYENNFRDDYSDWH